MGMTYDELSTYGRLRKIQKCGPYSMYIKLIQEWGAKLSPVQVSPDREVGENGPSWTKFLLLHLSWGFMPALRTDRGQGQAVLL